MNGKLWWIPWCFMSGMAVFIFVDTQDDAYFRKKWVEDQEHKMRLITAGSMLEIHEMTKGMLADLEQIQKEKMAMIPEELRLVREHYENVIRNSRIFMEGYEFGRAKGE